MSQAINDAFLRLQARGLVDPGPRLPLAGSIADAGLAASRPPDIPSTSSATRDPRARLGSRVYGKGSSPDARIEPHPAPPGRIAVKEEPRGIGELPPPFHVYGARELM
jgi:hypothetical protein